MHDPFFLTSAAAIGFLYIAMGIPLALRKVKPNYWYGLRVPSALSDEKVWYEANTRFGKHLILLGLVVSIAAVVLDALIVNLLFKVLLWGGLVLVGTFHMMFYQWRWADRREAEMKESQR